MWKQHLRCSPSKKCGPFGLRNQMVQTLVRTPGWRDVPPPKDASRHHLKTGDWSSPQPRTDITLILNFLTSRTMINKFLLFISQWAWYFARVTPKWTRTHTLSQVRQYLSFCAWLLSLNNVFQLHFVVTKDGIFSLLKLNCVGGYISLSIHSLVDLEVYPILNYCE